MVRPTWRRTWTTPNILRLYRSLLKSSFRPTRWENWAPRIRMQAQMFDTTLVVSSIVKFRNSENNTVFFLLLCLYSRHTSYVIFSSERHVTNVSRPGQISRQWEKLHEWCDPIEYTGVCRDGMSQKVKIVLYSALAESRTYPRRLSLSFWIIIYE